MFFMEQESALYYCTQQEELMSVVIHSDFVEYFQNLV